MHNITTPSPLRAAAVASLGLLLTSSVHATDFYWGSDTTGDETAAATSWQDSTHWFTDASGVTASGAAPGASDTAIFSVNSLNATALVPRLWAETTVGGIRFNNTAAFNMSGGGGNRALNIGAAGVTIASGSSAITIGSATANRNVFVRIQADQTWTNNSSSTFRIRNSGGASNNAGAVVVTMNAAGSGSFSTDGGFSDGTNSTFGIIVESSGTGVVSFGSSAYSGGTTIKRGILQANGAGIGTAAVRLGNTTGAFNATLRINTTAAVTSNLIVQAGNTGVNTLEFSAASGAYNGTITLDNDVNIGVRSSTASGVTINGVISGTGDLIKGQYQSGNSQVLILAGANTYTGDTFVNNGAFTLAEAGTLTFEIGANGDNNSVTGTSTGAVTFAGTFSFDLDGAELADGNSWTIVNRGSLTGTSFAATFQVAGFSETDNIWTNLSGFSFDEATGILSYSAVPEPSTYAALLGVGMFALSAGRRRR